MTRLSFVFEVEDYTWALSLLEIREQEYRTTVCIVIGTMRLGLAWRLVA